nr:MAG TPA: hypothetical protein [Caudoviricetes sp.]
MQVNKVVCHIFTSCLKTFLFVIDIISQVVYNCK